MHAKGFNPLDRAALKLFRETAQTERIGIMLSV
ncbi:hypothetical protein EDC35_102304 [Thiobaca trueperi]|uniref:Uncharacterized protein n=1 Tax=Thiobaca trueperi TaxID=127458 RepID=A0A4R3N7A0_9GAMM|nr:hypothetical protein EDC35_102304 [Thiobaca trueperi]